MSFAARPMTMLALSGADIRVDERGTGSPVMLVHGQGGDLHGWDRLWDRLNGQHRLIRYDLRDFGLSRARSSNTFSHVEDLHELSQSLGALPCDLIGVSMGGGIALGFALDHPELVRRLVVISPSLQGWEWSDAWRDRWEEIVTAARAGDLARARALWWEHPMFATTRAGEAASELREEVERFAGRQWIDDRQGVVMPDIERLHQLNVPTLLLTGERDVEDMRLIADIVEASSPMVCRVDVAGRGHLLQLEAPDVCAEEIAAFLHANS